LPLYLSMKMDVDVHRIIWTQKPTNLKEVI
jgi:hypothetical protein